MARWKPTVVPGPPPAPCVGCVAEKPELATLRPTKWLETDQKPLKPRCRKHQRAEHNRTKSNGRATTQLRVYGLLPDQHTALLEFQNGLCAVCLYANGKSKSLATDHDHKTGLVRGKLCGPDNQDIIGRIEMIAGRNGERPTDVLLRIIGYFESPPASVLRARGIL
jgi:hypothetical protein